MHVTVPVAVTLGLLSRSQVGVGVGVGGACEVVIQYDSDDVDTPGAVVIMISGMKLYR